MTVYLDNAATTPLRPQVKTAIENALENYGNPSSVHQVGQQARHMVDDARRKVAGLVNVRPEQVVFTSGGTESNNTAIFGVMAENPKKRLITTRLEHFCVLNSAAALARRGWSVTYLTTDKNGQIDLNELEAELKKGDVALVSLMHASNETGILHPIEKIAELSHAHGALFHTDAVQTVGHMEVDFAQTGADILTLAFHKFGGPKGVGAMILNGKIDMDAYMFGGGQERKRRSGTENVLGIVGAGIAAEVAKDNLYNDAFTGKEMRDELEKGLKAFSNEIEIVGENAERAPHITQFVTPGVNAADAVIAMDMAGVAVSQGSACSSGKPEPSRVLKDMGYGELAKCGLRVSFGWANQPQDVDAFLSAFKNFYK